MSIFLTEMKKKVCIMQGLVQGSILPANDQQVDQLVTQLS